MRSAVAVFLVSLAGPAVAQVKAPPPPDKYQVDVRYRIRTSPDDRIRQYRAMTEYLKSIGFEPDVRANADLDPFDPSAENLSGTLPGKAKDDILKDARVRTVLFRLAGTAYPTGPAEVRIGLSAGFEPAEQKRFHDQAAAQLARLGLVEKVGYDTRGFTVVRGTMPGPAVPRLLTDLRDLPAGWFMPDTPREQLNAPLRSMLPVRWVEVLGASPEAAPAPGDQPKPDAISAKVQPDARERVAKGGPQLLELVLNEPLPDGQAEFRGLLRRFAPGVSLEGVVGPFATVRVPAVADLAQLTGLPQVLTVRTPRTAVDAADGAPAPVPAAVLSSTRVSDLHTRGYNGAGTTVVVLGTGFEPLPGATLLDLTAEFSPTVEPAPASGTAGTPIARAVAAGAPKATLVLVRVDPSAAFQLTTVAQAALGDRSPSAALQTRADEQAAESIALDRKRQAVTEEYRQAFADLGDDPAKVARRDAARKAFETLQAEERALQVRVNRLIALRDQVLKLRGADVIVNTLVWEDGYALDGLSEVSRLLDNRFIRPPARSAIRASRLPNLPTWVQAAGPSSAGVWAGPLLDTDGNGAIEFVSNDPNKPAGWADEVNFLDAADGKTELPAGARLRLVLQWREAQDPSLPYSDAPAVGFAVRLIRQDDPTGAKASTDDFTEAARTVLPAVRLNRAANAAVFEQVLDVTLPAAGRYAVRVEARPASIPFGVATRIPEVNPRLTVRGLDGGLKPVFASHKPVAVGVGIPGDATLAFTVAGDGGPTGAGPGVVLRVKPDARIPGLTNSGLAAGYAGGIAASLAQSGLKPQDLIRSLGLTPGGPLVLPSEWLQTLSPR